MEALRIFDEIESEEKNKVSTLFGDGSKVSEYFNEITNGLYKVVRLNTEEKKIRWKEMMEKYLVSAIVCWNL